MVIGASVVPDSHSINSHSIIPLILNDSAIKTKSQSRVKVTERPQMVPRTFKAKPHEEYESKLPELARSKVQQILRIGAVPNTF